MANKLANSIGKQGKTGVKASQQWANLTLPRATQTPTLTPIHPLDKHTQRHTNKRYKRSRNPGKKLVSLRPALVARGPCSSVLLVATTALAAAVADVLVVGSSQNWQIQAGLGHRSWRKQKAENSSAATNIHTKKCWQCKNLYRRKGRKMQAADRRRQQPTKWVPTIGEGISTGSGHGGWHSTDNWNWSGPDSYLTESRDISTRNFPTKQCFIINNIKKFL